MVVWSSDLGSATNFSRGKCCQCGVQSCGHRPALTRGKAVSARITICGHAKRIDCMVDGHTVWIAGTKIASPTSTRRRPTRPAAPAKRVWAGGDAEDASAAQRRPLHADPDQARRRPLWPQTAHRRARRGVTRRDTGPPRTSRGIMAAASAGLGVSGITTFNLRSLYRR